MENAPKMDDRDRWLKHIKKLAKDNADLGVIVRSLRLEVTGLKDEVDHYKREFARQNAKILTMSIQAEVDEPIPVKLVTVKPLDNWNLTSMPDPYDHSIED